MLLPFLAAFMSPGSVLEEPLPHLATPDTLLLFLAAWLSGIFVISCRALKELLSRAWKILDSSGRTLKEPLPSAWKILEASDPLLLFLGSLTSDYGQ